MHDALAGCESSDRRAGELFHHESADLGVVGLPHPLRRGGGEGRRQQGAAGRRRPQSLVTLTEPVELHALGTGKHDVGESRYRRSGLETQMRANPARVAHLLEETLFRGRELRTQIRDPAARDCDDDRVGDRTARPPPDPVANPCPVRLGFDRGHLTVDAHENPARQCLREATESAAEGLTSRSPGSLSQCQDPERKGKILGLAIEGRGEDRPDQELEIFAACDPSHPGHEIHPIPFLQLGRVVGTLRIQGTRVPQQVDSQLGKPPAGGRREQTRSPQAQGPGGVEHTAPLHRRRGRARGVHPIGQVQIPQQILEVGMAAGDETRTPIDAEAVVNLADEVPFGLGGAVEHFDVVAPPAQLPGAGQSGDPAAYDHDGCHVSPPPDTAS